MRSVLLSFLLVLTCFAVAQQKPTISLWVAKDVAPSSKIQLSINTRDLPSVHVAAFPIDGEKWLSTPEDKRREPAPISARPTAQWDVRVAAPNQKPNPGQANTYYSRQINLPKLKPGVYKVSVGAKGITSWKVVNVTHLAVIAKLSPRHALYWVTNALTGGTVDGAQVNIYPRGSAKTAYRTGRDGAVLTAAVPGQEMVVITKGDDMAGLSTGAQDPDGRLVAHFQTDRPIYRPGQIIYFKSILRRTFGQVYRVAAGEDGKVGLRDSKDNLIDELTVRSDGFGTVNGQFEIPSEAATGAYTLVLTRAKESAYQTLTVAEYRKPEFKVDVKPVAKRYMAGDTIEFLVDAQYYFGAPVPQAAVQYTVRRSPLGFSFYSSEDQYFYGGDGNLYARDTYGESPFVASDTAYTDNDGKLIIKIPADKAAPDSTYTITLSVTDSSRRIVQAGSSVPAYAAAIRVAIAPELNYATLGSLIPIAIRTVDLDGKPVPAVVKLTMSKQVYNEKKQEYATVILESTTIKVPGSGKFRATLPAKEEGSFEIEAVVKDAAGRISRASTEVYVYGNFRITKEKPQPSIDIKLDRKMYQPGETAKAIVIANTPKLPVLVTLEGGDIWEYRVLNEVKSSQTVPFKASTKFSPNAYVSVDQWVKGSRLSGSVSMPVPDPSKHLKISITPERTAYHPGDKAFYKLHATDSKGKPVSAEIAVAVVDESIYALSPDVTPDPYQLYWGLRGNAVVTYASAPEELSGGAYQRVDTVAPLRQRFEDTAFWNAVVTTDRAGDAKFEYEVPGNLTSWRATARAVTMDTAVGVSTTNVLANRPVMLRLATPRQMVQGDKLVVIGTIDNRSDETHIFDVSLQSDGVDVDSGNARSVEVASKSQKTVTWELDSSKLPPNGRATLTGQVVVKDAGVEREEYSDALQVSFPIVPAGISERIIVGGVVAKSAVAALSLSSDRIEPASKVAIRISGGSGAEGKSSAARLLTGGRYSTPQAANQLVAASLLQLRARDKVVVEDLAYLSRTQQSSGWGWWERSQVDSEVTAKVLDALSLAKKSGFNVYEGLFESAKIAAQERFNQTNLWEHRALLASAMLKSGAPKAQDSAAEVLRVGKGMSPYARLKLGEALATTGHQQSAETLLNGVLKDISDGPSEAYVPSGDGVGWAASSVETTAQALVTLVSLDTNPELQARFARYLINPDNTGWRSDDEDIAIARALIAYSAKHPDAREIGPTTIAVNGQQVETTKAKIGDVVLATVPRDLLKTGENRIEFTRTGQGEVFYTIEANVFRPELSETTKGVRVLRRFEVQNEAGVWVELAREVKAGEAVRCTVIAWGDSIPDGMRVVEPLPSGFEFTESESGSWGREEVRDGAVIHYLENSGAPQTFVYYIRAESEGVLTVLPAQAEYLRRPTMRGHSNADKVRVTGG